MSGGSESASSKGGHDIAESIVRRRYARAFANLSTAIGIAHEFIAFDNSDREVVRLIAIVDGAVLETSLGRDKQVDRAIAEAIASGLGVRADDVFLSAD